MGCFGSKYKLSKADLQFLVENTQFTKQQIQVWYAGFIVDCPSGELSKAKFIEVYQQLFPQGNAQKFCSHIFRTFDTDNSGKIDFKEFLMAINITAKGDPEKKLKWAFKMYDVDGNGEIDKNEMTQIITSIYDLIGLDPNAIEQAADNQKQQQQQLDDYATSPDGVNLNMNNGDLNHSSNNNNNIPPSIETPKTRTDQIFEKMDVDKNGVITESEFINGCLQDKFLYQMLTADYSENN